MVSEWALKSLNSEKDKRIEEIVSLKKQIEPQLEEMKTTY